MVQHHRFGPALAAFATASLLAGSAACSRDADPAAEAATTTTIAVAVAPVQSSDEPVTIDATGGFEAAESSDVSPETSGRVSATLVDIGDYVKAGYQKRPFGNSSHLRRGSLEHSPCTVEIATGSLQ